MWNIVNELGKHDFSCVLIVNNLKDRKFFFVIKWVEIALTQFLLGVTGIVPSYRIRCLNSAVNEIVQYNSVEPQ